ncbi:MAG: RNB domain-containing ribonuclease [Bacteroidales bacterium]|nr:RNB domain-containing ribonuclease [Bacteroidales bacterium]
MSKKGNRKRVSQARGSRKRGGRADAGSRGSGKRSKRSAVPRKRILEELTGRVIMGREGYGFIDVPDREDDVFVPARRLRGALHGDTVRVAVTKLKDEKHRMEGEVLEVLERSTKPYIGVLQIIGMQAWVIIENKFMPYDIGVPMSQVKSEWQGLKVAVVVEMWREGMDAPLGRIVDVLGEPGENNTEMHAILAEYGLPYKFDEAVEAAAAKIPVKISKKELEGRRDFRKTCTFTIDPADAKDYDDAISFRLLDNGNYEVGVHIADVTHYVKPGDIVDKEAIARATSVYLVDRTVPMLPEALSNNLCSLRPNEEKLTFSAVFELNAKAKVINKWFGRTIIKSDRRFAYEEAQLILENAGLAPDSGMNPADIPNNRPARKPRGAASEKEVVQAVIELHKLAAIMRKQRFESGSIGFERPEMKVIVDDKGKPVDVKQKISREANWLIEEFMLLANKEVAKYVTKGMRVKEPTFVYRIHEEPDYDKVQNLRDFVKHFGYTMGPTVNGREVAKELNLLLEKVKEKPECGAIEIVALRSMARAKYSTDNVGHYGLGFQYYTHFTSPIRRYPDMMVHRLLAHYLNKGKSEDKKRFEELCKHSSQREQLATEAERASIKFKLSEYMQDKVGNEYDGTVSGVTEWGIYVEIEPTKVEGMVSLRDIKEDYFIFDEKNYCVFGKSTKVKFTLGDKVRIRVSKVNVEQKLIDYELIWDDSRDKTRTKAKTVGKKGEKKSTGKSRVKKGK